MTNNPPEGHRGVVGVNGSDRRGHTTGRDHVFAMPKHRALRGSRCGLLTLTTRYGRAHLPLRPELVTMVAHLVYQPAKIVKHGISVVPRSPVRWQPLPAPSLPA